MRVAKVFDGTTPMLALVHGSGLYRATALETILGSPLPAGIAGGFDERVFGLGLLGLDSLQTELSSGMHLEDTRIHEPWALLPPVGRDPAVLDLGVVAADGELPRRVSGRALFGDGASVSVPRAAEGAGVGFGIAFIVGDDLRRSSAEAAWSSVIGACLAVTCWLGDPAETPRADLWTREPTRARELGTSLGPWMVTRDEWPESLQLLPSVRAAQETARIAPFDVRFDGRRLGAALAEVSAFAQIRAGDVLVVTTPPTWVEGGTQVSVEAPRFGCLTSYLGGPPSIPGDGLARIDR